LVQLGAALVGKDEARLEEYMETVNLEVVVLEGGVWEAATIFTG